MAELTSPPDTTLATGLALFACILAGGALIAVKIQPKPTQILLYDSAVVTREIPAYAAAGQEPFTVINAAVEAAVAQGYIVIDTRDGARGPESAKLHLGDFVAVGGDVGRREDPARALAPIQSGGLKLNGTIPVQPGAAMGTPAKATAAPAAQSAPQAPGADVKDFARQLMGGAPPFSPKSE